MAIAAVEGILVVLCVAMARARAVEGLLLVGCVAIPLHNRYPSWLFNISM